MFRKVCTYSALILIPIFLWSCASKPAAINDKLVRFHVIANSDLAEDQSLKLKVRDRVLEEIGPKLEECSSKDESEDVLGSSLGLIKQLAEDEVFKAGQGYGVSVTLGKASFPTKVYSTIALPAGEYDALKVVLGKGEGKNWWCVMFPPLCFVDITRGVTSENTEKNLRTVLDGDEYDSILAGSPRGKNTEAVKKPIIGSNDKEEEEESKTRDKVEIRFKSLDLIKSFFAKVERLLSKK